MKKKKISKIPPHYSAAVVHEDIIYISGQLPICSRKKKMVTGGIKKQTKIALENFARVLSANGSAKSCVLKVTIYLADIKYWDQVNEVYAEFFATHKPARSIVPTKQLHFGALIEIDGIAYCL